MRAKRIFQKYHPNVGSIEIGLIVRNTDREDSPTTSGLLNARLISLYLVHHLKHISGINV